MHRPSVSSDHGQASDPDSWPCLKLSSRFSVQEQIGKGSFGDVYRAIRLEDGLIVCLKVIDFGFVPANERYVSILLKDTVQAGSTDL